MGVIWDGLEPEPGYFNEPYLARLGKHIHWALENSLYVFLDMHQDLYSVLYADGAPKWATLKDGMPHIMFAKGAELPSGFMNSVKQVEK